MRLHAILLLFVCSLGLTACGDNRENQDKRQPSPVTIGFLGPLSGEDQSWGRDIFTGCRFVLEKSQKKGRYNYINLTTGDDRNNPAYVEQAFKKLVEEEHVSAILAASDSRTMLNTKDVADKYRIPVLSLTATHPEAALSSYVSQILFDDITQGTVAALYVIDEMLISSAAILFDSRDPHSDILATTFSQKFKSAGGKIQSMDKAQPIAKPELWFNSLKEEKIPFLYLPLNAEDIIESVKILKKINYNPQIMISDGLLAEIYDRFKKNIADVNGMFSTDVSSIDLESSAPRKELIKAFRKEQSTNTTSFTLAGAEGMLVMLHAIERCNEEASPQCINNMLHSTRNFQGVFSKLTIDDKGKAERAIYISQINNGRMHVVVKVY